MSDPIAGKHFDLVTMRAVRLESKQLAYFGAKILNEGGIFAWWAGPGAETERQQLTEGMEDSQLTFEGEHTYSLPSIRMPRCLLVWKKRSLSRA
jgi:16S rRNA G527 N7-methylase RsmG